MTYAPKIQGELALNQIVVHLALVTQSIAGLENQATFQSNTKKNLHTNVTYLNFYSNN